MRAWHTNQPPSPPASVYIAHKNSRGSAHRWGDGDGREEEEKGGGKEGEVLMLFAGQSFMRDQQVCLWKVSPASEVSGRGLLLN